MRIAQRTKYCFWANFSLLCLLVTCAVLASPEGGLFVFGPAATLKIGNVIIDTWLRYSILVVLVCLFRACSVIINDIGMPNLGFSIYDPTTETVYGFRRTELQLLANGMFMVTSLSSIFSTLVIVSRLDVAVISTLASELASAASIYYLLGKKRKFIKEYDTEDEAKRNSLIENIV